MPAKLKQTTTGRIYIWTPLLAKRSDMEPYEEPVAVAEEDISDVLGKPPPEIVPKVTIAPPAVKKSARGRKKKEK